MQLTNLTKRQCAIISAHTGLLMGDFSDMHEYAEEVFGHPIFTHQFGSPEVFNKLNELSLDDWENLENEIPDDVCAILCNYSGKLLGSYGANQRLFESLFDEIPTSNEMSKPEFSEMVRERIKPLWIELCELSISDEKE